MKNNIGTVIEKHRQNLGLTRKQLAVNICSENYLYLIEKGKRTPSIAVTTMLGDKIGINLFEYYEYLDCEAPICVKRAMDKFEKCRAEIDLKSLKEITIETMELPDFQKIPWIYEIKFNQFQIEIFEQGRTKEAIKELPNVILEMEQKNVHVICIVNFYILLYICYQMEYNIDMAKMVIELANKRIEGKQQIPKYRGVIVSVRICELVAWYFNQQYESVIKKGLELYHYEIENSYYERSNYTLFCLAFAYYKQGLMKAATNWFIKALCLSIARYKPKDIYYLVQMEPFQELLKLEEVPKELVTYFKVIYPDVFASTRSDN